MVVLKHFLAGLLLTVTGGWARSATLKCDEGAVSWRIIMSCMRHVTDAYAGMIMTGMLHKDTLVTSLTDSCRMSWPQFPTCAREKLRECNLDESLADQLHQSSMCEGDKPRGFILELISQLPDEVDVSCVTQSEGGSFQPCVAQLFGGPRPQNLFLPAGRTTLAKRYVGFIKCAVDLVADSTCQQKEVMATVFTVFGLTTAPSSVLVTEQDLETLGILVEDEAEVNSAAEATQSNRT